jgi:hypothetical protein
LAEGKMRQILLPPAAFGIILQTASCKHFQEQIASLGSFKIFNGWVF